MQVKTFTGSGMQAVLAAVKAELGSGAVILDTQEEKGVISITAAVEQGALPSGTSGAARFDSLPGGGALSGPGYAPGWQEEWGNIKKYLMALVKPALRLDTLPLRQRLALEFLQREGVTDSTLLALHHEIGESPTASVLDALGHIVPVCPWGKEAWPQRIHMVAGPFGAGKSSVALRMALGLRKAHPGLRVCMVNADATRAGGRLFLRQYSELSDLAYKEAASTLELVASIDEAKKEGFDRIFIDLPGLSQGKRLSSLLEETSLAKAAVHLVLSPQHEGQAAEDLLTRYCTPNPGSLIWAKLDEAEHFGQIINTALRSRLPVSALSYGPGLGNSFVPAKDTLLWRLIFKRELPASA